MREIKWTRDEAGNRIWSGKIATYRVVSAHGPWFVEIHPPDGVVESDEHDDSTDVLLVTLDECKVFIDGFEDMADTTLAYTLALAWRNTKKS